MIGFDIEAFVRKYMTKRAESLLAADFAKHDRLQLREGRAAPLQASGDVCGGH